jgi:hypothetical protein
MCVPTRSSARSDTQAAEATTTATTTQPSRTTISTSASKNNDDCQKLSWTAERKRQIDDLNVRVEKLTKVAIANAQKSGKPLDPEYVFAQQPMTVLVAGTPVYQIRSALMVYLYSLSTFVLIACGVAKISLFATALSVATIFLGYDLYSGVLHVVLDHPDNISLPILGQPCLEFQWHHAIPDDLVRKDFVDVCGDLNTVVLILAIINCLLLDVKNAPGVAMVVGGMKLWMAYFGQYSHRSAHSFGRNSPVAEFMQKYGLMISPKAHLSHHKAPHDTDFCLIGICNPIIDAMRAVTTHNGVWLTLFLVWSVFDVVLYVKFVEWVVEQSTMQESTCFSDLNDTLYHS